MAWPQPPGLIPDGKKGRETFSAPLPFFNPLLQALLLMPLSLP